MNAADSFYPILALLNLLFIFIFWRAWSAYKKSERREKRMAETAAEAAGKEIAEREKLERKKDECINLLSHELRTPLTTIKTAVDNLQEGLGGPLTEKQGRALELTQRNIERLAKIVGKVSDISKLQSGEKKIVRTKINLREWVEKAVQKLEGEAKARGIALQKELKEEKALASFTADAGMLSELLAHLVENALHFAKGKVLIKVSKNGEGELQLSVIDDGPGIAPEYREYLFEKFSQIERPVGAGYQGLGLSLAICKEIIQLHDGKIWGEFPPEGGSRFHCTLPFRSE